MLSSCCCSCCVFVVFLLFFFVAFLHNIIFKFNNRPINDKGPSPNIAFSPCSGRQNLVLRARKDRKYKVAYPISGVAIYRPISRSRTRNVKICIIFLINIMILFETLRGNSLTPIIPLLLNIGLI